MKNVMLLLFVLLLPVGAVAQEVDMLPRKGRVLVNGEWQFPTPETALRDLLANAAVWDALDPGEGTPGGTPDWRAAAVAVLRQVFNTRPAAELDAFANELGRLLRDGTKNQSRNAFRALRNAASELRDDGTRYAGAVDIFIRIYESYEVRTHTRAEKALRGVLYAGGVDYVRQVFEASEKPPACQRRSNQPGFPEPENPCPNVTTWCSAGRTLMTIEEGPHPDVFFPLCELAKRGKDGGLWYDSH